MKVIAPCLCQNLAIEEHRVKGKVPIVPKHCIVMVYGDMEISPHILNLGRWR